MKKSVTRYYTPTVAQVEKNNFRINEVSAAQATSIVVVL